MKFLKKVPLLFYAILIVILSIYLTHFLEVELINAGWLSETEGEAKVALYSSVLTIIGIFYGVLQLQSQTNDSLFANEYINQPDFEFLHFCSSDPLDKNQSPGCCCEIDKHCTNNCNDEHWFNLKQIGNLPATKIKISMFHKDESKNICSDSKTKDIKTLNKNGIYQYKLPPYTFDDIFFKKSTNDSFLVLLTYKSLYSKLKYKRVYKLEYSPVENQELKNGLWGNAIKFYDVTLIRITDSNSLSLNNMIIGSLSYYLYKLGLKDFFTIDNWVNKY